MSGSGKFSFNAPATIALPKVAPQVFLNKEDAPEELAKQAAINQIYRVLNLLTQSLVNDLGIGPRNQADQPLLAGIASTIKASNQHRFYVKASDILLLGSIINLWSNGGVLSARLANATDNTKPADGFCSAPLGLAIGDVGEVILSNGVITTTGLTLGQRYWLSTTSGMVHSSAAIATGNIEQYLGIALSSTEFYFSSHYWIQH